MSRRVLLTSAAGSFAGLGAALADADVALAARPLLDFAAPERWAQVDEALAQLNSYAAVAVTSPRGAAALAARLDVVEADARRRGVEWRVPPMIVLWTTGVATAAALAEHLPAQRWPDERAVRAQGAGAALAAAMLAEGVRGPVLYGCGDQRRDELPATLRAAGVEVHDVICYRTVLASPAAAREALADADLVLVASPSVVRLLATSGAPVRPPLLAVGPTTAAAAAEAGWPAAFIAEAPTTAALARAIRTFLSSRQYPRP